MGQIPANASKAGITDAVKYLSIPDLFRFVQVE